MDFTISSQPKRIVFDDLSVRVYAEERDLAQDAAKLAQNYLQSLLQQQEIARVVLATGNSQIKFLEAITTSQELDWSRITFFHLDEYLGITADHPASFRYYLQQKVEQKIPLREFHYLQGDALQPIEECRRYSQLLQQKAIDLCLLGLGDNGHLAFNEPTVADFADSELVKIVKLEPITRQQQVYSNSFANLANVPQYAYTLTVPAICSAKQIFCLASGEHKAEVVSNMLQGSITTDYPASILRKQKQATLFLDQNSASLI
ncbi:MAG: glucosamine-6-phosphate deaminase [Xenococcaceae cyanobacterium MO_188.B29]|nr:glucosamine-6-phosphate deaminase [Xenococcaceae cyanobacterium MO_188.B29]